ncbi:glycosyltransferase family 4 protein [Olleya aquimaris]|uniref:Glycosyltransferase involved in cell wall biosynthesis n=1 Tax=Olleya aquimaris TaxID=639310 RepID=A0A327RN17_9FLAO|nr:glycosyltransferase family 4 protein [Olleya aquimaris]RAJ16984.1 glycosyltransferase involved in cell wall biosynthesis [Olleya aquimaris]
MLTENIKKITIIGLIDNIGGREIEARNIIIALSKKFEIKVVSMFLMTEKSEAIKGLNCNWTNVYKEINRQYITIRFISYFLKHYHKRKTPSHFLVDNKISRRLFNLSILKNNILKKEIDKADAILYCGTLSLNALNQMIIYCNQTNTPIVLRTTGKIQNITEDFKKLIPKIDVTLVHSLKNGLSLMPFKPKKIIKIDQTSLQEQSLLNLKISATEKLVYGFLGRFSAEKGIIELMKNFNTLNELLIIAGSGPLHKEVNCLKTDNITILKVVSPENISDYFKKIDVLIIPSYEEAGPLVGVEAMAAGKIILSTKVGAMEDRLKDTKNNFWFDINDKQSLIDQINFLAKKTPEMIVEIRENVRSHYINNYSIRTISNNYIDIFKTLLD